MVYLNAPTALNSIRFEGITRKARKHFMDSDTFDRAIDQMKHPYVGQLPTPFLQCGLKPREVYEALDQVAGALQKELVQIDVRPLDEFIPEIDRVFPFGNQEISVKCVGKGMIGVVFQMKLGENTYAMKTFFNMLPHEATIKGYSGWPWDVFRRKGHGCYGETASGLFLSKYPIKNMARFYCGNPKAKWSLDEWITPDDQPAKRSGKDVWAVFRKFKLFTDELQANTHNANPHGIYWDRGGIRQCRF